ncbi:MAG: hypothetical protein R6X29_01580 [Acidimicrobiia bacterium]|jgi:hypothetical protein
MPAPDPAVPIVAVDVPLIGDERHKHWAKVVVSVDTTKSSGYAFEGEFIAAGGVQDVPTGAVVLVYGERGSRASPQIEARVYTANPDGTLSHHASARGRAWARTLRDAVEELLDLDGPPPWEQMLIGLPDTALAEELARRGWRVLPPSS